MDYFGLFVEEEDFGSFSNEDLLLFQDLTSSIYASEDPWVLSKEEMAIIQDVVTPENFTSEEVASIWEVIEFNSKIMGWGLVQPQRTQHTTGFSGSSKEEPRPQVQWSPNSRGPISPVGSRLDDSKKVAMRSGQVGKSTRSSDAVATVGDNKPFDVLEAMFGKVEVPQISQPVDYTQCTPDSLNQECCTDNSVIFIHKNKEEVANHPVRIDLRHLRTVLVVFDEPMRHVSVVSVDGSIRMFGRGSGVMSTSKLAATEPD